MPGSNNQAKTRDGIVDISFLEYINADQTIELFTKGIHQEDNDDGEEGHHENRHRYKEAVEKVMEYVTPFSIEIDAEGNVVSEAQQSAHPLRLQVFKRQLPPGAASTPSRCCACSSPSTPGRPSPSP